MTLPLVLQGAAVTEIERLEAEIAAAIAEQPDARNIGGRWVACLCRKGPRTVMGVVLEGRKAMTCTVWNWSRQRTLLYLMDSKESRDALLEAAGPWPKP